MWIWSFPIVHLPERLKNGQITTWEELISIFLSRLMSSSVTGFDVLWVDTASVCDAFIHICGGFVLTGRQRRWLVKIIANCTAGTRDTTRSHVCVLTLRVELLVADCKTVLPFHWGLTIPGLDFFSYTYIFFTACDTFFQVCHLEVYPKIPKLSNYQYQHVKLSTRFNIEDSFLI